MKSIRMIYEIPDEHKDELSAEIKKIIEEKGGEVKDISVSTAVSKGSGASFRGDI